MKSIKELEKAQKLFKKNHKEENPVIQIRIDALKDVLGLLKTNKTKEQIIKEIEG